MIIESQLDINGQDFRDNTVHHGQLLEQYQHVLQRVQMGGSASAQSRLRQQGKLPVRERIQALIDPGTEFLELSALAGLDLYDTDLPSGGIVTGIGLVHERPCMVIANDPTVKGGTYFPITAKKHLRAQEIAELHHLPCLYLVDSGGAFLPMQSEVFPDRDHFGRVFYNQARMSAKGIPQLSIVHGFCTAGGAYIPAMSDQSIIVDGTGSIFLAGPPLVKAATGEDVTADELGGADVHTRISGVADHFARDDGEAIQMLREIIRYQPRDSKSVSPIKAGLEPRYDPEELLGIIPADARKAFDMREVIARIVDDSYLFEFKRNYGNTLVTGFAHICGFPVGIIANNGVLFSESALKGTHFVELCCRDQIPLVFLQNITGFIVGKEYEHKGIAKDGAKLVHAVANANVPKLTMVVGGSYGAGNYGMCGRAFDPSFMFMWPNARIAVMGGEQAASVLGSVKVAQRERAGEAVTPEEIERIKAPILAKYDKESSVYYATARLWDDGIVSPVASRRSLAQALAATQHHPWTPTQYGIFRM